MNEAIPSLIEKLGVPGCFCLLLVIVIKPMVMALIAKRRNGNGAFSGGTWDKYDREKLNALHEWHKPDTETRRFPWYARNDEIVDAINKVGVKIDRQTTMLETFIMSAPCQKERAAKMKH